MESKYLVGLVRGQPAVMWDKIQDFEENVSEDGQVTIKFKEDDIEYEYHGTPDRGYTEINHKGPDFQDYQYMGRRTALRHDLFNPQRRDDKNFRPGEEPEHLRSPRTRHELEDPEDYEADEFLRRVGQRHTRIAGCGPAAGDGGRCGLWG